MGFIACISQDAFRQALILGDDDIMSYGLGAFTERPAATKVRPMSIRDELDKLELQRNVSSAKQLHVKELARRR